MRACASVHVFNETDKETWAHNDYSRCFVPVHNRDMFRQMYDFSGRGVHALPFYFEKKGWQKPEDYNYSAFHMGVNTHMGMWEYLNEDPERMKIFNSGMRSLATVANNDKGPYPFDQELNKEPLVHSQAALVDVGGGRGQALERIRQDFPNLQGRLILQDQESVVADAKAGGLSPEIEAQGASFFEPNPVKNARAYHFRRIFHDWSDKASVEILRNTASAMGPSSKILISDNAVPSRGAPRRMALQDLNMMSFAGMERTEDQWIELLEKAKLEFVKFWKSEGSNHVILEAKLP